jgi:hypothetical protein
MKQAGYEKSVFINCPFDEKYKPLFQAIVFTVMDCGFYARCALETFDSSQVRISKIYDLIASCRLGIHDLSRTELDKNSALPRFNMPLEFGIFLGAKALGDAKQKRKICLILDEKPYRYQQYLSDVAGQDTVAHNNDPKKVVAKVRGWLSTISSDPLPSSSAIWDRFQTFSNELPEMCRKLRQKCDELTFNEYLRHVDGFRVNKEDSLTGSDIREIMNPGPTDIRRAVESLHSEHAFLIYNKAGSGMTYMQTAGNPSEGFVLEYQVASVENHYQCVQTLSMDQVLAAFQAYASGDNSWRKAHKWKRISF